MVVVDSSALIPFSWVGRLDLVATVSEEVHTTEDVRNEVQVSGKRGTEALDRFLESVIVHERVDRATEVASLEGIAVADASVIVLAEERADILLTNDKALIETARSHGVSCWWVTTVLLKAVKEDQLTGEEAGDFLYDMVVTGMNLHPNVYPRVQRKFPEIGGRSN